MSRRRTRIHAAFVLSAGALVAMTMVGCGHYRGNPTPGVGTLNVSNAQNWNRAAITRNTNIRAMRGDFANFWLYDKPSRMHRQPSPY